MNHEVLLRTTQAAPNLDMYLPLSTMSMRYHQNRAAEVNRLVLLQRTTGASTFCALWHPNGTLKDRAALKYIRI